MNLGFIMILGTVLLIIVGIALIEAYFRRKEQFVDKLQTQFKGFQDG